MALINNVIRSNKYKIVPPCLILFRQFCLTRCNQDKSEILEYDSLDELTTQMIQKKSCKWEGIQAQSKLRKTHRFVKVNDRDENKINLEHKVEGKENLDIVFKEAMMNDDIFKLEYLICSCITSKQCPSIFVLNDVLPICALEGQCDLILKLRDLCKDLQPKFLRANAYFDHYLAEALWSKGDITSSLTLFEKTYAENEFLRRQIRMTLNRLFLKVIDEHTEAILRKIIQFSEQIGHNFDDYYLLTTLWQICFLSDWFSDQCLALDLLERNRRLWANVLNRLPFVVNMALSRHQTEIVYRLLEVLLKKEMKTEYSLLLQALFDYRLDQKDLRSCCEIVQWSRKYIVNFPNYQIEKFLRLTLLKNVHKPCVEKDTCKPNLKFRF